MSTFTVERNLIGWQASGFVSGSRFVMTLGVTAAHAEKRWRRTAARVEKRTSKTVIR